jgi:succinate dehydrogenase / fumarate reductase, flavoprotein subunit
MEKSSHDLLILGAGLAGQRAAIEASRATGGKIDIALVSKVHPMRSHSVAAEGGTAAVLRPEEGDTYELHAWDTVKGSDFLADQDAVDMFVRVLPEEISRVEHWGVPWTRDAEGRIDQRPFGGHSFPRAVYAADKTGFFLMQTMHNTLLKYDNITRYDEFFATSIEVEDGRFRGITALEMASGQVHAISAKACIVATGGVGRLFNFTSYSHTSTGDGYTLAYRAGIPLKDMEFVQFHPTGLMPSGILVTEASRGEGGHLLNSEGKRFLENYAPKMMELAPRDIISRAMVTEIQQGRGIEGPEGIQCLKLDLRHIGSDRINSKIPFVRELSMKFLGIDPVDEPIPVRPVQHYTMGGIETDTYGATRVRGLWAAGEAACVSIHGANRLGTNSLAECLVYGRICGQKAAEFTSSVQQGKGVSKEDTDKVEDRIYRDLLKRETGERIYEIRQELRDVMDANFSIFRTLKQMEYALGKIREMKSRLAKAKIEDTSRAYNTDLTSALELENMVELAEVMLAGGIARQESRGAHSRLDYPTRDDRNWLKHTLAHYTREGPRLDYSPIRVTIWKPTERRY